MDRHSFLAASFAALVTPAQGDAQLAALEHNAGGRLGVYALDTGTGSTLAHRATERFPMCSTFKLLLVAAVLARVDAHNEDLGRSVAYGDADMVPNSPVTKAHLKIPAMTVGELCTAAIEYSDNTATNLLLHSLLGPAGVTRFARKIGDPFTRLDRNEPSMSEAVPGDPRDTTTPRAMAQNARNLVLGNVLSPRLRARLLGWLEATKTGSARLRAGVPATWREADKTGTGDHGTANDVAIFRPPQRAPIIVAAYYTQSPGNSDAQNAVLANVARIVTRAFA